MAIFQTKANRFALLLARAIVVIVANRPLALRGHVTNASFKQELESYWCQNLTEHIKIILHAKFERKSI